MLLGVSTFWVIRLLKVAVWWLVLRLCWVVKLGNLIGVKWLFGLDAATTVNLSSLVMEMTSTITAVTVTASITLLACFVLCKLYYNNFSFKKVKNGIIEAVGNTPLIRIHSLSQATGCEILGKAEFLNPGGSVKDRVALKIIQEALELGLLAKGGIVTEGSAGSTAISLATVASSYGCQCHVVIPDDAAIEKSQILEALGATVERVRPVAITHKDRYVNIAELDGAFRGTDMEAVEMSRFLLKNDGLFVGSSSAMNCVGAVRVAQSLGPGHVIVTILCDNGMRHLSKFHNAQYLSQHCLTPTAQYLSQHCLTPTATGLEFLGLRSWT